MSVHTDQRRFHALLAIVGGITCAAGLAIGLTIWWLRSDAIDSAYRDSGNLAAVLRGQISNSADLIDEVLDDVQAELKSRGPLAPENSDRILREDRVHQFITERLAHLPNAVLVGLIDQNGKMANTTQEWPTPNIDLSNTPHYQHFKHVDDGGIYITSAQIEHINKIAVIFFSRRINDANKNFLGVVSIGVSLSYFQQIYESIARLPGLSVLILHKDGTIIVRYPDPKNRMYEKMPVHSPWHQLVSQGGGQYRSPGYFDGEPRLIAVRPLSNYPLVINVGISEDAALATWRVQAITLGSGALLAALCIAFLLKAQSKQFKRLAVSEATLSRAGATVDAAINNMSQGLVMFDSAHRLVVCNQRYLEMYGLTSEVVRPGCSLHELLKYRISSGHFSSSDPQRYSEEIIAGVAKGIPFSKVTVLPDGRTISVVNNPVAGGGWVATHEDITDAKKVEERIFYAAHHDALTGLPNRKFFSEQLEQALKRARHGEPLAVLYLDLDHLKRVNDTLGHAIGDKLLKGVAERIRRCVRDIDLVARLSGDEFAITQISLEQPSDAADLAMRVRDAIHEPFHLDNHQVTVDISVGISIAPNDGIELHELLKTADIALYEAKNTGRGTYRFYEKEMNERMQKRDRLERDLQSALANGEFELHYQPVVNLEKNKIGSFEALLRWHHPTRGFMSPLEFIHIAEETGFIVPLGEWVLRQACAEAANWPNDVSVAVNISSIQLTNKNLINAVIGAIAAAGISADRLILEVTESAFLQHTSSNLDTLMRLHELGVQFAMDDFGTGYSSLGYLLSFPFKKIKIDRSFIVDLSTKKVSRAVVRAITDLARNLRMQVVAEGVETAQQVEQLRRLGCTDIQGYIFSAPRPAAELQMFFQRDQNANRGAESIKNRVA